MLRLGVNIDHVATVRNARGENYPDPIRAANFAIKCGANSITLHLREDRRHIRDSDLYRIIKYKKIPINLEIAPNNKMVKIALDSKPNYICLVPEKRKEITTEGGLNLSNKVYYLKKIVSKLNKRKIRTSLFINPNIRDVKLAKLIGSNCVELHTGKFSNLINKKKNYKKEFDKIKKCSFLASNIGLKVHAGHGLSYKSAKILSNISEIEELNIGHFIISESIFYGLKKVLLNFKKIVK